MPRKILNFGSINIDHVYTVNKFVKPGETKSSEGYHRFLGGKGLNQSVALANAGVQAVYHAGCIGYDGDHIRTDLENKNINTSYLHTIPSVPTGHAVIQVTHTGENCIILYKGANYCLTSAQIHETLAHFSAHDIVMLQNETNLIPEIILAAKRRGMLVVFNPAPFSKDIFNYPLHEADYLILNYVESQSITGETQVMVIIKKLQQLFPTTKFIVTLGKNGMIYQDQEQDATIRIWQQPFITDIIDTTAAGDTVIGYFIAGMLQQYAPQKCLELAARAAALCIAKAGASQSIPMLDQVLQTQLVPNKLQEADILR